MEQWNEAMQANEGKAHHFIENFDQRVKCVTYSFSAPPPLSVCVCVFSFPFSYKDKQCPLGMSLVSSPLFPLYWCFSPSIIAFIIYLFPLLLLCIIIIAVCSVLFSSSHILSTCFLWNGRRDSKCGRQRKKGRERRGSPVQRKSTCTLSRLKT